MQFILKTIFRTIFVAFILPIFSINAYSQVNERNKLIPIPTKSHNNPIEVFYKGEKPTKKYYQLAILEAYRNTNDTYAEVVNDLKIQAQESGMDAIIITELQIINKTVIDWEGFSTQQSFKEAIAYGIKYELDFSFLKYIPKIESIYVYDDSIKIFEPAGFIKYDLWNHVMEYNCPKSLFDYQYEYSLLHLFYEESDWKTYRTGQIITKRVYKNDEKTCWFKYDSLNRITDIEIQYQIIEDGYTIKYNHEIMLTYDENGRLYQKKIYPKSKRRKKKTVYYIEIFKYDNLNRLKEQQLLLQFGDDLKPITKSFISEYYTEDDLKKLYPELRLR